MTNIRRKYATPAKRRSGRIALLGAAALAFTALCGVNPARGGDNLTAAAQGQEAGQGQGEEIKVVVAEPRRINRPFQPEDPRLRGHNFNDDDHYMIRVRLLVPDQTVNFGKLVTLFGNDNALYSRGRFTAVTPNGFFYWNPFEVGRFPSDSSPRFDRLATDLDLGDLAADHDVALLLGPDAVAAWRDSFRYIARVTGDEWSGESNEPHEELASSDRIGLELDVYVSEKYDEARAQQITLGLLKIIEQGVRQRLVKHVESKRDEYQAKLTELQPKLEETIKSLEAAENAAGDTVNLSDASISDIRTNARLLQVEFVGLSAKVTKCEEILEARKKELTKVLDEGEKTLTRQIEGMKLEAEVELASLAARKEVYESLLAQIANKEELSGLQGSYVALNGDLRKYNDLIEIAKEMQARLAPLQLYQQTIEVIPLKPVDDAGK